MELVIPGINHHEVTINSIRGFLERQGCTLMVHLTAGFLLGGRRFPLVDGGRLAAVLLLLKLCYPCIPGGYDLLEFINGAGKLVDYLGLCLVLVSELGELGRLLDPLKDQFLIGRRKTVNLAIESFKFLLPSNFWYHLNPISLKNTIAYFLLNHNSNLYFS